MATKRTDIMNEIVNRMKGINGAGGFFWNLGNRVTRVLEEVDSTLILAADLPGMYVTDTIAPIYAFPALQETILVELKTVFNSLLTPVERDEFMSDMFQAMGDDFKLAGNADSSPFTSMSGKWLYEDKRTEVIAKMRIDYRRLKNQR